MGSSFLDGGANFVTLKTDIGDIRVIQKDVSRHGTRSEPCRVLNCLGLQYATIPYRWAAPRLTRLSWQQMRDCTSHGPGCPQMKRPLFNVDAIPLFGPESPSSLSIKPEAEDEFRCLNLNIYAPKSHDGGLPKDPLPVLVWVHGGAYVVGCGCSDLYDGSQIVARSVAIGAPVIVVTFNYRLGVLGFLHSRELAAHAALQDDLPPHFRSSGNLGLLDCYCAFEWVRENIAHFGGDPNHITGMGESAGSAMLSYLSLIPALHIHIPRMVLSSSTVFSNQLLRPGEAQKWFDTICEAIGVAPDSPDVITKLSSVPVTGLIESSLFAQSAFRPIWDDATIATDPRRVITDPTVWDETLEGIIFGNCQNECYLRLLCHPEAEPNLAKTIIGRIPPTGNLREIALQLYDDKDAFTCFDTPSKKCSDTQKAWMAFDSHARYYATNLLVADSFLHCRAERGLRSSVYKYIFGWNTSQWRQNEPATHTADILPLFLHESLLPSEIPFAQSFADNVIVFAQQNSLKSSWVPSTVKDGRFNILNYSGEWTVSTEAEETLGLNPEMVRFWREVVHHSLMAGREGWDGITR